MQKDVIYIDVEDDITAIIGKVKASSAKIVALVPPKRIGAIQSAVNLKLVHRATEQADKRLVIITNNAALSALAGSAGIPVAKNLQSKPEMAEVPALEVDEGEDVIDGDSIAGAPKGADNDEVVEGAEAAAVAAATEAKPSGKTAKRASSLGAAAVAAKDKVKIPDFDSFRKKLFLAIAGVIALIAFLVWAIIFAPQAQIIITAQTSTSALNTKVSIADNATTSLKDGTIKSITKTTTKDVSVPFTATGTKDVGTKATGSVQFYCDSLSSLTRGVTIAAGTQLASASGKTYTVDSTVALTVASGGSGSSNITATGNGTSFNGASGTMSGADLPRCVSATIKSATTGGTDKTVTVVQQSDVDSANAGIPTQADKDAAKKALAEQFTDEYFVLDATFKADASGVKSSPGVDAEAADGKGTLAGAVTYSLTAIPKAEVGKFLDSFFAQKIDGKSNQKIYGNGIKELSFTEVSERENGYSVNITTNGKIGPKIDEVALKEFAKGKRFGEIQAHVEQTDGVDNVDVKFSPFWVRSAPNDVNRIKVEFKVND